MIELFFNKRLKTNYSKVLELQTAKEIENFLSTLNEKERKELFAFTYGYAIQKRLRQGIPITEYFLIHYDDFIPNVQKDMFTRADKYLNIIFIVAIIIISVVLCVTTN